MKNFTSACDTKIATKQGSQSLEIQHGVLLASEDTPTRIEMEFDMTLTISMQKVSSFAMHCVVCCLKLQSLLCKGR